MKYNYISSPSTDNSSGGGTNIVGSKAFSIKSIENASNRIILTLNNYDENIIGCHFALRTSNYFYDPNLILWNFDEESKKIYFDTTRPDGGNYEFTLDDDLSRPTNYLTIIEHPELGDMFIGENSVAIGEGNIAYDIDTFSAGRDNKSVGQYSFTAGRQNEASYCGATFGRKSKSGQQGFAAGYNVQGTGDMSVGFGNNNKAAGQASFVANTENKANALDSAVFGRYNEANETETFVAGTRNVANGQNSAVFGLGCISNNYDQFVQGKYNVEDADKIHIVGYGNSDTDRKNVYTLDKLGNAKFTGNINAHKLTLDADIIANGGGVFNSNTNFTKGITVTGNSEFKDKVDFYNGAQFTQPITGDTTFNGNVTVKKLIETNGEPKPSVKYIRLSKLAKYTGTSDINSEIKNKNHNDEIVHSPINYVINSNDYVKGDIVVFSSDFKYYPEEGYDVAFLLNSLKPTTMTYWAGNAEYIENAHKFHNGNGSLELTYNDLQNQHLYNNNHYYLYHKLIVDEIVAELYIDGLKLSNEYGGENWSTVDFYNCNFVKMVTPTIDNNGYFYDKEYMLWDAYVDQELDDASVILNKQMNTYNFELFQIENVKCGDTFIYDGYNFKKVNNHASNTSSPENASAKQVVYTTNKYKSGDTVDLEPGSIIITTNKGDEVL